MTNTSAAARSAMQVTPLGDRVNVNSQGHSLRTDSAAVGLQEALGRILDRANTIATSSASKIITLELLDATARALRCELAVFWEVHPASKVLYAATIWKQSEATTQELERDTCARQLTIGEGIAGHVWRSLKTTWATDITRVMCLPRCIHAEQAGLGGGIWIPLKTVSAVYGVLELLGRQPIPAHADAVLAVERLAVSLGYLIEATLPDGFAPRRT